MSDVPSLGVVSHAVGHQPMPLERCLACIAEAGGEHVMLLAAPDGPAIRPGVIAEGQFPNLLDSDPEYLAAIVHRQGLRLGSIRPSVPLDLSSDEAAERSFRRALPYAAFARRAGCDHLCLPPPFRADVDTNGGHATAVARLARLMDMLAEAEGRVISVDVHSSCVVETVDDCRALLGRLRSGRSGVVLNLGHLTTNGQPGWELIREWPERVPIVAWKDHSLAPNRPYHVYSVELGTGDTPLARYVAACKAAALPAQHVVNVMHAPAGQEVVVLKRSLDHLRQLWATTPAEAAA